MTEEQKQSGRGFWSDLALSYHEYFSNPEQSMYKELEVELLKEFTNPGPGARILDVCCGTGRNTIPFGQTGAETWGLDAAPGMIEEASKGARLENLKNVAFVNGDVCLLPFPDNTFDAAIGTRFMYMMETGAKARLLVELHRVLKPDGTLALQFNGGFWGIRQEFRNLLQGAKVRFGARYLWPGQVHGLFKGYQVETVVGVKLPWLARLARIIGGANARALNRLLRLPGFCYLTAYLVVKARCVKDR